MPERNDFPSWVIDTTPLRWEPYPVFVDDSLNIDNCQPTLSRPAPPATLRNYLQSRIEAESNPTPCRDALFTFIRELQGGDGLRDRVYLDRQVAYMEDHFQEAFDAGVIFDYMWWIENLWAWQQLKQVTEVVYGS